MKNLILLLSLSLISLKSNAQITHAVELGDERYMFQLNGNWTFKDSLPDGRWIACRYNLDTTDKVHDAYYEKGLRNGKVSSYYSNGTKIKEVGYRNGIKHGTETYWFYNGSIGYSLSFKNGKLDGPIVNYWNSGELHFKGYYANNVRDSIWSFSYYEKHIPNKSAKVVHYKNGRPFLVKAWDQDKKLVVDQGEGTYMDLPYKNGLLNGTDYILNQNNDTAFLSIYKNGLEVRDIGAYITRDPNTKRFVIDNVEYIQNFSYDTVPTIDTTIVSIDSEISDVYEDKLEYNFKQYKIGTWKYYYESGQLFYSGAYKHNSRTGPWNWYYPNGQVWISADFSKNSFSHYDSSGVKVSDYQGEFISILTENKWFAKTNNFNSSFYLKQDRKEILTKRFVFKRNGKLRLIDWLEPGKKTGERIGSWEIHGNILTIKIEQEKNVSYRLELDAEDVIRLTLL